MNNLLDFENFILEKQLIVWDSMYSEFIVESTAEFDYKTGTATFNNGEKIEVLFGEIPSITYSTSDNPEKIKKLIGQKLYDSINVYINKVKEHKKLGIFFDRIVKFFSKKKNILYALCAILILNISAPSTKQLVLNSHITEDLKELMVNMVELIAGKKETNPKPIILDETPDIMKFLDRLAQRESSNDYTAVNSLGYIGKYQFGGTALKDLGLKIKTKDFKNNPSIFPEKEQDEAMIRYLKMNKNYLGDKYLDAIGKTIKGIKITLSGLLAASHLVGQKSVKDFIDSNGQIERKDANGTKLTEYLSKFGGFNIKDDLL